jgi:hypothetical protein
MGKSYADFAKPTAKINPVGTTLYNNMNISCEITIGSGWANISTELKASFSDES